MKLINRKIIWLVHDLEENGNSVWWFATREHARKFKNSFDVKYRSMLSTPIKFVRPEAQTIMHGPNEKINIPVLNDVIVRG